MAITSKNKTKTSRAPGRLKIAGTMVLLASFITQQFFLNEVDSQIHQSEQYHQHYNDAYQSSLQYINLFFSQAPVTGVPDGKIFAKAAQEHAEGYGAYILSLGLSEAEQLNKAKQLMEEANKVSDLDSYNNYMAFINTNEEPFLQKYIARTEKLRLGRLVVNRAYLGLYLIGSLLLLMGMILDERTKA
jgi:hypothetical protein